MAEKFIEVEVAYARPEVQTVISLQVPKGATAEQAVIASGIMERFPEINGVTLNLGVFGKACAGSQCLQEGDRVEIYRSLLMDPKEHRRFRAAKS